MIVRRTSVWIKKKQIRKEISKKKIEDWAKPSILWFLYSRIGAWNSNSICVHVQHPIKFAVKLIQLEILGKQEKKNKCIIRLNRIGGQKKMTKIAWNVNPTNDMKKASKYIEKFYDNDDDATSYQLPRIVKWNRIHYS